jgi:hypothetical protein
VRLLANPASLDYVPVAGGIEDHATMAVESVAKAARAIEAASDLFAVELLVAAQAIGLRDEPTLGKGTRAAYAKIRERVPLMVEDRLVADDIRTIGDLIVSGELLRAVAEAAASRPVRLRAGAGAEAAGRGRRLRIRQAAADRAGRARPPRFRPRAVQADLENRLPDVD